ncbi:NAD kinase 2, mitochondrial-like [Ostrea edulis]|uniref:NAD kinase 2, mitochondrial-like n=1 Tax=Ostrea edulis TaxID=37623 RepID=UPI0024AFF8A5|nr:NAD kinase 2, mitochondrial-like [Ostrea edulis]
MKINHVDIFVMASQIWTQQHNAFHFVRSNKVTQTLKNFVYKNSRTYGTDQFKPKKAVVLRKMTRYEFEKMVSKGSSEEELKNYLEGKRSDYNGLRSRHENHCRSIDSITKSLVNHGIETKVVSRHQFTSDLIQWADVLFTAGGDGTYLLAASKVFDHHKPLIGINTDPSRSEGCLCLPKEQYSGVRFEHALQRLLEGKFRWKRRQRIRITMSGHHENDEAIELHDQQLQFYEHRFSEHVGESETYRQNVNVLENSTSPRVLPVLALNEVFIGECLSSRVSYYKIKVDDHSIEKHKSSGIAVCTGTGSTSWFYHINNLPQQAIKTILGYANELMPGGKTNLLDSNLIYKVTQRYNDSLKFDPSEPKMAFTTRDPVRNGVFQVGNPKGFAKQIQICSRMWDACLVVDGGSSFKFNDGAVATLEIREEDALKTVVFD